MGNYYCKNCGVPIDYYNVDSRQHMRPSCRKVNILTGTNSYHEWRYFICPPKS